MSAGNTLAAAREYLRRGWRALPANAGDKQCYLKDWPELEVTLDDVQNYFTAGGNVVVVTGARSRGLIDIDLDCSEAVALADVYLPATEATFGRPSKRQSHRLYIAPGLQFAVFGDPLLGGKNMLLEVRAEGHDGGAHQTLFPPSVADDEARQWVGAVIAPRIVDAKQLHRAAAWLAIGCLVARHVGETPARRPGRDLPKLLAEADPTLGERAAEWLQRCDPPPAQRQRRSTWTAASPSERELAEIIAALPNANLDFWEWNRIGLSIFRASDGSAAGLDAFHKFSKKSAKYQAKVVDNRWKNHRRHPPRSIGIGTLIYSARQSGRWPR